jgi:hypothetical protein
MPCDVGAEFYPSGKDPLGVMEGERNTADEYSERKRYYYPIHQKRL